MTLPTFNQTKTLADFYQLYVVEIRATHDSKSAKSILSKLQTAWTRYVLPAWGFALKLNGNLSPEDVAAGMEFMQQISLEQVDTALAAQVQVYESYGDLISPQVRRVYRSSLRKCLEWGKNQAFWQMALGTSAKDRAPVMFPLTGERKPPYSLSKAECPAHLLQEIDHLCHCWRTSRSPALSDASIHMYLKNIYGVLGWLHRVKGIPTGELSLFRIVPCEALSSPIAAQAVAAIAAEYLNWLQSERKNRNSTRSYALKAFVHTAEYVYHVTTNPSSVSCCH